MPRSERVFEAIAPRPNRRERRALVAAGKNISEKARGKRKAKTAAAWQNQAWQWYDEISEYRFAVGWVGNMVSRANLVIQKDGVTITDESDPAVAILKALYGGPIGQTEMLRAFATNLTVTGDSYMIADQGGSGMLKDRWRIASPSAITSNEDIWKVAGEEFDTDKSLIVRVFRPHPLKYNEGDCPTRALLPVLAEINGFSQHIAAQIDSRLAGAGLMLIPSEITGAVSPVADGDGNFSVSPALSGIIDDLMQAMMTAIANREDASALVPVFLQAPAEVLDKVRHLVFSSALDKQAAKDRLDAIRRLGLGMEMPPEVLTGTGDMNHWGAWQVDEAGIQVYIEPLLKIITSALTEHYLWAALTEDDDDFDALDEDEARRYAIVGDTAALRVRPNRSKEAFEAYDRGELSATALLREIGFDPDDKMQVTELQQWLLRKIATGTSTPEMVNAAAIELGVPLPKALIVPEGGGTEAPSERTLKEHPVRELPASADGQHAVAAELMMHRALERAGNRLKSKFRGQLPAEVDSCDLYQYVQVDAGDLDALLEDAWTLCDRFGYGIPRDVLDSYARQLILSRKPYSRELMTSYLSLQKTL